jgi:MFS family permease
MLSSIHPLGERARNNRWGITATAFILGAVSGGVLLLGTSATLGWLANQLIPWSATTAFSAGIVVVALAVIGDLAGVPDRLPWPDRQVNEDWLTTYRGWVYGFGFGFQLGAGLFTYVTTLGVYATIIVAFLTASPVFGLIIGTVFGLMRGLPILTTARVHDSGALRSYHAAMARMAKPARSVAIVAQFAVVALAVSFVVVAAS